MASCYLYFTFVVVMMTFIYSTESRIIARSNQDIEERILAEVELRGGDGKIDKLKDKIKDLKMANKALKKKDNQLAKAIGKNTDELAKLMKDHGECPDDCSMNGVCISSEGVCLCNEGFFGQNCADFCLDRVTCNDRGYCNDMGICVCDGGPDYFNGCTVYCNATTTCNGNGQCASDGSCECDVDDYFGTYCNIYCNATTCNGNGTCAPDGSCECDDGYFGTYCDSAGKECAGDGDYYDVAECCSSSEPCGLGSGDCDDHDDCAGDLICGYNNCGSAHSAMGGEADCCIEAYESTTSF